MRLECYMVAWVATNGRVGRYEWSCRVDHQGGPPILSVCVGAFIWISWCLQPDVGAVVNGCVGGDEWSCFGCTWSWEWWRAGVLAGATARERRCEGACGQGNQFAFMYADFRARERSFKLHFSLKMD